jgi:hypothetical protein
VGERLQACVLHHSFRGKVGWVSTVMLHHCNIGGVILGRM